MSKISLDKILKFRILGPRIVMNEDTNIVMANLTGQGNIMKISFSARRLGFLIRERGWKVARFESELQRVCFTADPNFRPTNTYAWVKGTARPHTDVLPYIAYVLNIKIDDLFERGSLN